MFITPVTLKKDMARYADEMDSLLAKADAEHRNLTQDEMGRFDLAERQFRNADRQLRGIKDGHRLDDSPGSTGNAIQGASFMAPAAAAPEESDGHVRMIGPGERRDFHAMFPHQPLSVDGWKDFRSFCQAVHSGKAHPELRGVVEGIASDGGFVVPTQFASRMYDTSLESEIVRPRATIFPMTTQTLKIPAAVIGSHASNLYGGSIAYWGSEATNITESKPTFRQMELNAGKLSIYTITSNEWAEDGLNTDETLRRIFTGALGWYLDRAFFKGTGAGMPLGILNSAALVTVTAAAGEGHAVSYTDLTKMMAAMYGPSFQRSVWVAHQTVIPSLLQLTIPVGTGGSYVPVLSESNGTFTMLTRPVVFTEKLNPVGSKGDLLLADFSQYAIGLRYALRLESTQGLHFQSDQTDWRTIARVDGQPLWDAPLTLEDGTTQVSPFVVLSER